MSKVCVVIEHWDNEERWEDEAWGYKVLAVAGNPSTAENIIAGRKAELIKRAEDFDDLCSIWHNPEHDEKYFDALRLEFTGCKTPFDSIEDDMLVYNKVAFYWKIEDHEIES